MKEEWKKKEAEVDNFYADLWAKDIAIKSQREEETAREQIERNRETLKVIQCINNSNNNNNNNNNNNDNNNKLHQKNIK